MSFVWQIGDSQIQVEETWIAWTERQMNSLDGWSARSNLGDATMRTHSEIHRAQIHRYRYARDALQIQSADNSENNFITYKLIFFPIYSIFIYFIFWSFLLTSEIILHEFPQTSRLRFPHFWAGTASDMISKKTALGYRILFRIYILYIGYIALCVRLFSGV